MTSPPWRLATAIAAVGVLLALVLAPAARAASSAASPAASPVTAADPNTPVIVADLSKPPPGYRLTGAEVQRIAAAQANVRKARAKYPGNYAGSYTKGPGRWQVSWFSRDKPPKEIAQVYVDDATRKVTESYTSYKVAWTMARGYPGAFGRKVNSPLVWVTLSVLFVAPFFSPRRPRRLLHVDLLVLVAFGVSVAYFNDAQIDVSVPLVYPLLAYVLARMLWIGLRTRPASDPAARGDDLRLWIPTPWLAVAVVFLAGFRIGLNVTDSNVIDVGYAGVIGAHKLVHGEKLYGTFPKENEHGDTYGPVTYAAYVPFTELFGWSGTWDDLPAAHAAAIFFDLLALTLCFLVGRRVRGPTLGVALAYAWAAFPFTLYSLSCNANDTLVAVLLLAAVYLAHSAPGRGAAAALGGLTKFATLAVAPLMATFRPEGAAGPSRRAVVAFTAAFAAMAALALSPVIADGQSLQTVYDRTVGFQAGRGAPFSIWGLYGLSTLQHVWEALAVILALAVAVVPRRRDVIGLSALAAGVVIALQMGITYWFYLYLVWSFPLVMLALLGRYGEPARSPSSPR